VLSAPSLKEPPGDAVLRAYDGGVWTEDGFELRGELREAVGFYAEEDDVHWADIFEIRSNFWMRFEIAIDTLHANAMLLHRAQVRAAGEERDILAGTGHARSHVGADCAGTGDEEFHVLWLGSVVVLRVFPRT
jgi:hypothetical protein